MRVYHNLGDIAKLLGVRGFGRTSIFRFLRKEGILDKFNIPKQSYIDMGYFKIIPQTFMIKNKFNDSMRIAKKPVATDEGVGFLLKLIKEKLGYGDEIAEQTFSFYDKDRGG